MNAIKKEVELSDYVKDWINSRYSDWKFIYNCVYRDRKIEIYKLKHGPRLMDLFNSIIGYIEEYLIWEDNKCIIPTRFSSIDQFLQSINAQNNFFNSQYYLIEDNINGSDTHYIITDLLKILNDFQAMKDRCWDIYHNDHCIPTPYQQAVFSLHKVEIRNFIDVLKSIIADVPYDVHKEKISEGYFHTLFHVITSVIGLHPISEKTTCDGRIDTLIETPAVIYIIEFKYSSSNEDVSQIALQQIIDNKYNQPMHTKYKQIIGIGISYSKDNRNINGHIDKLLFNPSLNTH